MWVKACGGKGTLVPRAPDRLRGEVEVGAQQAVELIGAKHEVEESAGGCVEVGVECGGRRVGTTAPG